MGGGGCGSQTPSYHHEPYTDPCFPRAPDCRLLGSPYIADSLSGYCPIRTRRTTPGPARPPGFPDPTFPVGFYPLSLGSSGSSGDEQLDFVRSYHSQQQLLSEYAVMEPSAAGSSQTLVTTFTVAPRIISQWGVTRIVQTQAGVWGAMRISLPLPARQCASRTLALWEAGG